MQTQRIVLAGATGHLGQRIAAHLVENGAEVIALVRQTSGGDAISNLERQGVQIARVEFSDPTQLKNACTGAHCVVSALSGLEEVILTAQTQLLKAAIEAGVKRFIPSDYCIDYNPLEYGSNRNLDLRRKFRDILGQAPIQATSILNGMFSDLLTGQAPVVIFKIHRVVYWGSPDQLLDFTTIENTAAFTAKAAIDNDTPRYLRIAGDVLNAKGLAEAATYATGKTFKLLKAGSLKRLQTLIKFTRALFPQPKEVFPPWQGMQYLHNMFTGKPKLHPLDNERYKDIRWTRVRELLKSYVDQK